MSEVKKIATRDSYGAALKALGRKELIKTTETLDREALKKEPAEVLESIGAYIRTRDEFYYDIGDDQPEA